MLAYRFETKITKDGLIKIPISKKLFDKDVEIVILPKRKKKITKSSSSDFIKKWSGFLSGLDIDGSKSAYLSEKYK